MSFERKEGGAVVSAVKVLRELLQSGEKVGALAGRFG
jgi:hypothetical protein